MQSEQQEYQSLELAGGQHLHNGGPARANETHTERTALRLKFIWAFTSKKNNIKPLKV